MDSADVFILISIAALAVTALVLFLKKKGCRKRLSPLAGLAFAFVIAGVVFGDDRLIGYSLMGIGIAIAVADVIVQSRKKRT